MTVTECQRCGAKSQLFLCQSHIDELREMLGDMPRLAQHLAEAATGQTRLGEQERRSRSESAPMRINLRASQLLGQVNLTLVRLVQEMCDNRGMTYRALEVVSDYDGDAAKLALWLARHVDAIAADESAGDCFDEVYAHIAHILRVINRPVPPRFCGPCPSPSVDDDTRQCGTALMAKRDAIEVRCPECKNSHNIEELILRLVNEVDHWRFTRAEILLIMGTLGEPLNERTFQRWRKLGIVKSSGYRRVDGRIAVSNHSDSDEPVYRLADVRRAKAQSTPGKAIR